MKRVSNSHPHRNTEGGKDRRKRKEGKERQRNEKGGVRRKKEKQRGGEKIRTLWLR